METLFYLLTTIQILLGTYLVWQGVQWLGYVRRRLHSDPGFYAPRVALLCPCRGMEPGLERNLVALTEFERQNYEIFFILASEKDPARSIIERVAKSSRVKANLVIAGHPINCGEKVAICERPLSNFPKNLKCWCLPIPTAVRENTGCTILSLHWRIRELEQPPRCDGWSRMFRICRRCFLPRGTRRLLPCWVKKPGIFAGAEGPRFAVAPSSSVACWTNGRVPLAMIIRSLARSSTAGDRLCLFPRL